MKNRLIRFLKKLLNIQSPSMELCKRGGLTEEQLVKLNEDLYNLAQKVKK